MNLELGAGAGLLVSLTSLADSCEQLVECSQLQFPHLSYGGKACFPDHLGLLGDNKLVNFSVILQV